jgi:hypothetical protein
MRTVGLCAVLSALMVAGCASSKSESYAMAGYDFSKLDKVAIIQVTGSVYADAVKNKMIDMFTGELIKRGYTVVERANVQTLLKEQQFQSSGVTSDQNAAKAGRILNVPAVVTINVPKYKDDKMEVTAKLIEVETGAILWIGSGSGSTNKGLATVGGAVLGAAAGAVLAGGSSSDRVLGAVAGGAIGGVAGYALTPEQETQVRKVIADVCKELPYKLPPLQKK